MDTSDPAHPLSLLIAYLDGLGPETPVPERTRIGLEYLHQLGFAVTSIRTPIATFDRSPAGLRGARERLRLTQARLADEAGVSTEAVRKAESGGRVKDSTLALIVAALIRFGASER